MYFIMEKIVKMDGFVYLVKDWDRKGFETYLNLGKYDEETKEDETPKKKTKKDKKQED